MAGPPIVEIREPGRRVRRRVVDQAIEFGRECEGEVLSDESVSRRHLRLVPSPVALSVVDLDSRNGTTVNGVRISGRVALEQGAVVRLGGTEIVMIGRVERAEPPAARATVFLQAADLLSPPPPPPQAPAAARPASAWSRLWGRILGTGPRAGEPLFPAYTEMRSRIPLPVWHGIRIGSVLCYMALCVALFVRPAGGLFVFFKIIVPLLPILFFAAPGLWRNICPLAASNQAPRVLGFTRALTPPDWLRRRGYVIAVVLFFGITGARLAVFNASGTATGVLLSVTIVNALIAGVMFKGKSGWCSSTCPLLPLQRVYGQTPFAKVPNSHCQPCVGCTKNCYDFRPSAAYQADLHEPDPDWTAPRKLFVAALPGFVLGFFTLLSRGHIPLPHLYVQLAAYFLGSVGLFYAVQALLPVSATLTVAAWASVAINIFYWYAGVTLAGSFTTITGVQAPWLRWLIRAVVLVLSLFWIARTYVKGRQYEDEVAARPGPLLLQISPRAAKAVQKSVDADTSGLEVRFSDTGRLARAAVGTSLLELAEREHQPVEAGCRMGVCGADPVAVLDGGACLSEPDEEELNTLRRLGFAKNTRMACCARIQSGPVAVSMTPEPGGPAEGGAVEYDRSIVSVVVLGNGIAGVTAADFVRRGHPDCEIHLVGGEPHVLYNRMGISRLVFGRSAMQGLYLLPEQWYDDHQVVAWLNTVVSRVDPQSKRVLLATGEVITYDRLILAMGSSSTRPPVGGFGGPGSFVLRSASDAMEIRAFSQRHACREAVVAGGGLLGLEAAHSLHELGLHVTILERGERLLSRQVDARCSAMIDAYFAGIGMSVLYGAEAQALTGEDRVRGVALKDGRELPGDVFLAAVGIGPNVELAEQAGIAVNRGVLVNDRMETSVPGVFAAGDVAEHDGRVLGLWPIAAKQGEVAALNALGGDARLTAEIPATILKGVGIDLYSIGKIAAGPGDEVIADEDPAAPSYRWLLISNRRAVGAIVLGHHPDVVAAATAAIKNRAEVGGRTIARLRQGDWAALKDAGRVSAPARA